MSRRLSFNSSKVSPWGLIVRICLYVAEPYAIGLLPINDLYCSHIVYSFYSSILKPNGHFFPKRMTKTYARDLWVHSHLNDSTTLNQFLSQTASLFSGSFSQLLLGLLCGQAYEKHPDALGSEHTRRCLQQLDYLRRKPRQK